MCPQVSKETKCRGKQDLLKSKRGLKIPGITEVCQSVKSDLMWSQKIPSKEKTRPT